MTARRSKRLARPVNLPEAMNLCIAHARARHNRSVENVADLMALPQAWRLYKWMEDASMPSRYIRAFENACGASYVTEYLAHSAHRLLIDIPTGRTVVTADLHALQAVTNEAVGALIAFAAGQADAAAVIAATTRAMEGLAWHRANAEKHQEPELELEERP